MIPPRRFALVVSFVSVVSVFNLVAPGCGPAKEDPPPPPPKLHTTYRVLSGISMGAVGTAALGLQHPERFDAVGIMGGPIDAALLLRTIDRFHLGGFCPLSKLEALAAEDPAKLNDPAALASCEQTTPTIAWEHPQNFNHWVYTSNGGTFDRNSYLELFTDLTLAYGNLLSENPDSPYAPPGVDPERLRHPPADFCTNPIRVKGVYNAEYNPEGKYDAITFCDGEPKLYYCKGDLSVVDFCSDPKNVVTPLEPGAEVDAFASAYCADKGGAAVADKKSQPLLMLDHAGRTDACRRPTRPLTVALAVDLNGNGRRDYGEPLVDNGFERYDDVGTDGCANPFEDGNGGCTQTANPTAQDPNHDDYDADSNPLGTESNWVHDPGEPFRDFGLDGVPGTHDSGEGNGEYDLSSGRRAMFGYDARTNYLKLDDAGRARLNVFADGGIRDLFNFGLASKQVFGLVKHFRPDQSALYRDFIDIPNMKDSRTGNYNPWGRRWTDVARNLAVLYGKDQPTDEDRVQGDGDHVGTTEQAVNRVYTLFNWTASQWPSQPKPAAPFGGSTFSERARVETYDSAVLGAKREYAIFLPPGYDDPANRDARYPVLFMLHGYGMDPAGFLDSALVADSYMLGDGAKLRPMIIVFPSGRCCFVNPATGERDCRELDDAGAYIGDKPGFERECVSGSFYVNRRGYTSGDETRYGDALFELMDHIDQTYRTLPATDVEAR